MSEKETRKDILKEYCSGCGLCHSVYDAPMYEDEKGFRTADITEVDLDFLETVCPTGKSNSKKQIEMLSDTLFGSYKKAFLGWSSDADVRRIASSGGVLTELCIYMLENKLVDGIIQTKASLIPIETVCVVSRSRQEVIECSGSRYSISSPLYHISDMLAEGEKYAFVGKPCDCSALRQYMEMDRGLKNSILYLLSFFCAGQPSKLVNERLLQQLGSNVEKCERLVYRGNGWPGYTKIVNRDGSKSQMTYEKSWCTILGRDVRKTCKFCMDGIGLMADIACGDAWYTDKYGKPDFSEHEGRNIIYARTLEGVKLLNDASKACRIIIENGEQYSEIISTIQESQYLRKATMYGLIVAMKIFRRSVPPYSLGILKKFGRHVPVKIKLRRFFGSCKRIVKKQI